MGARCWSMSILFPTTKHTDSRLVAYRKVRNHSVTCLYVLVSSLVRSYR